VTRRGKGRWAVGALGALAVASCGRQPLVARALAARGDRLASLVRRAEVDVEAPGITPGPWQWRTVFLAPDRWAVTIATLRELDHHVFDGHSARTFIGDRVITDDPSPTAPMRTQARFMAVVLLEAFGWPGVRTAPLAPGERPPGTADGLAVTLADGARYRLGLDERGRVVWAAGPIRLPPLVEGDLEVRYDDFRRVDGVELPFVATYSAGGRRLARERTVAACPNDPRVVAATFDTPALLPDCRNP